MRQPKGCELHKAAPKEYRKIPNLTGDHDLDSSIMRCPNKDMPKRLKLYTTGRVGYSHKTNYGGRGDD